MSTPTVSPGSAMPAKLTTLLWRHRPRKRPGSLRDGPSTRTSTVRPTNRCARSRARRSPRPPLAPRARATPPEPLHALDRDVVGDESIGELGRLGPPARRVDEGERAV